MKGEIHHPDWQLGPDLRAMRVQRGLSLAQAAHLGKISKSALAGWEAGRRLPSGESLSLLLDALDVKGRVKAHLLAAVDPRHARIILASTPEGAPVHLGEALRAMRLRRGTGQAELARRLSVSQSTIARWESGDLVPENSLLHATFYALEARPEEIEALVHFGMGGASNVTQRITAVYEAPYEMQELLWLALEADLWWRNDIKHQKLLLRVKGRRAQWCHYTGRIQEAENLATRLVQTVHADDVDEISPAIMSLLFLENRKSTSSLESARKLERWASVFRLPEARAWIQAELAVSLAEGGESSAPELAKRALDLGSRVNDVEATCRTVDLARVHLRLGQPELALEAIEGKDAPDILLVRAEAMLQAGVEPPVNLMDTIRATPSGGEAQIKQDRRLRVQRQHRRFLRRIRSREALSLFECEESR